MSSLRYVLLLLFAAGLIKSQIAAGVEENDAAKFWNNFRGPTGNGVSETAIPPVEWSATKNVAWKLEIPGRGSSSPVVWGDKVFLTTAVNTQPADGKSRPRMNRREIARKFDEDGVLPDNQPVGGTP